MNSTDNMGSHLLYPFSLTMSDNVLELKLERIRPPVIVSRPHRGIAATTLSMASSSVPCPLR